MKRDVQYECIGTSTEGRPLICAHFGSGDAPLRVLIIAGQHGDERQARKAALSLAGDWRNGSLQLGVVVDANPDGSARRTRFNAAGIDLNRDHQRLEAPETRALHEFVRRWRPHAVIDVHNYPSRRRHLLSRNLVLDHDVFIDGPTHPAICLPLKGAAFQEMLATVSADLRAQGIACGRYTLIKSSGRVRHSTPDIVDARNGLSLRYGALGVLLEGRKPRRGETKSERERLVWAQSQALKAILQWLAASGSLLLRAGRPQQVVPVRCHYARSGAGCDFELREVESGARKLVHFPQYASELKITREVPLPAAYAVPLSCERVLAVLGRHGIPGREPAGEYQVERCVIESARPPQRLPRAARNVRVRPVPERRVLDGFALFGGPRPGSRALAVFLEPESKYGLHRYSDLNLPLTPGSSYPVLRVVAPR
jgi:hypothetical protein